MKVFGHTIFIFLRYNDLKSRGPAPKCRFHETNCRNGLSPQNSDGKPAVPAYRRILPDLPTDENPARQNQKGGKTTVNMDANVFVALLAAIAIFCLGNGGAFRSEDEEATPII